MLKNNPVLLDLKNQFAHNEQTEHPKKVKNTDKNLAPKPKKQPQSSVKANQNFIDGRVKTSNKSYGFLETEDGVDYFITPKDMHKVFSGDYIKAKIKIKQPEGSLQASPVEILEKNSTKFIGQLNRTTTSTQVDINRNINHALYVVEGVPEDIPNKAWIEIQLSEHFLENHAEFKFTFVQMLANEKDPWFKWKETLAKLDLPTVNSEISATDFANLQAIEWDNPSRKDLTALEFFTIDGNFTKDMDDAIYIEKIQNSAWRLLVAIADPEVYIDENSDLDANAKSMGSSIYLPGNNDIAMFPKNITENLCSLVANQTRPVIVCEMQINFSGAVEEYKFYLGKIVSKFKLNYAQVSDFLENSSAQLEEFKDFTPSLKAQLLELYQFSTARLAWRAQNNLVNENTPKFYFDLNANAEVIAINDEQKLKAHQMIEETMLIANYLGGEFLRSHNLESIYISYSGFAKEKLNALKKFLNDQAINYQDLDINSLAGYKTLLNLIATHSDSKYIEYFIRRYQAMVTLSTKPLAHFGLGFTSYLNWSSPIRRYGDLTNHRVIKHFLETGEQYPIAEGLIDILQESRKKIRTAEREINNYLYYKFLKDKPDIFLGEIAIVNKGGIKVNLTANGATVFVPISLISNDSNTINCDINSGKVLVKDSVIYKLGDKVKIKLVKTKGAPFTLVGAIVE